METMHTYSLLDRYNTSTGITAMARTTAYTASIIVQLMAEGRITVKGIIPPENLGMKKEIFNEIMSRLKTRGVNILHKLTKART